MPAHSAAAESYRGIGVDDDFLDYVFNNNSSTSSIIISRVADDDGGFLRNNVKNTNMIVITPTSQVKPTIVDVVATSGAASTVTKAQSHQAIIDELHLTSSRPPPLHNDNTSTPKRCNITKKKHVIEQFFSSTFSLTDSSIADSHKSHLDDDGDDSYKSHLHDDDDDDDHDDDDESIVNDDSIGDVSITWSFSDIQSDGDNGGNSNNNNNNNNNVINVNYKYDGDDEDTTSIGGVVTIEDIILGNAAFDKEHTVQDDDAAIVADKNELFDQLYDADDDDDDDDDDTSKWSLSAVGGNNDDRDEFIESVRVRLGMVEI